MTLIAINPSATKEYSLRDDTSDDKTIFVLGVIDSLTRAYIDDTHTRVKDDEGVFSDTSIHDKYVQFLRFGLKGWRNLKDANGNQVEFKTEDVNVPRLGKKTVVTEESLKALDLSWIVELGFECLCINKMDKDTLKN